MAIDDRRTAFLLGGAAFLAVAVLGHHTWGTVDAIHRLAMTRSLLTSGSVVTPEFGPVKYGPLQSVLMLPFYGLGYAVGILLRLTDPHRVGYRITAFCFSPLAVGAIVAIWYQYVRRRGYSREASTLGVWTLLGCTLLLPYSRLLFSEPVSALTLLAAFACLVPPEGGEPHGGGFLCLGAASLNYVVFLPLLLFASIAVPTVEAGRGRCPAARRLAAYAAASIALTVACWGIYNYARFNDVTQFGYIGERFSTPLLHGMYGLILSPGRGLVFYSLPTVVGLLLSVVSGVHRDAPEWRGNVLVAGAFLGYLVLYSLWGSFEGGWCWGPRFLLPFVPLLHLSILPAFSRRPGWLWLVLACGLFVNAWEYSSEWQAYERTVFGDGKVDYLRSVFEIPYTSALHGFAGRSTVIRLFQFLAVALTSSIALRRLVRRRSPQREGGDRRS